MGLDDATKLHERLGTIFKVLVTGADDQPNPGFLGQLYEAFPSYTWQLVFGPIVVVAGLFVLIFLMRHLPALYLKSLVLVAMGLFAVAVGMDSWRVWTTVSWMTWPMFFLPPPIE